VVNILVAIVPQWHCHMMAISKIFLAFFHIGRILIGLLTAPTHGF
jgi:hypothetical protein